MLPHTYERLFVDPNKGDDVPSDAFPTFDLRAICNSLLFFLTSKIQAHVDSMTTPLDTSDLYALSLLYWMCGYGTLPDYMDDRSAAFARLSTNATWTSFNNNDVLTFGNIFDAIFSRIFAAETNNKRTVLIFDADENEYDFTLDSPKQVRRFFSEIVRIPNVWYLSTTKGETSNFLTYEDIKLLQSFANQFATYKSYGADDILQYVAYQMICSQFYTMDTVDSVYSSKLWLLNMEGIANNITLHEKPASSVYPQYFEWNGLRLQYDLFSKRVLNSIFTRFSDLLGKYSVNSIDEELFYCFAFYSNLFVPQFCLRNIDYFAGSRTQPLAVGDVSAPVTDNRVSAIDTTKSISYQRFLNAVNRARQTLNGYVKSIFGVDTKPDFSCPRALSSEVFNLSDSVNINTADNQGDRRSNINSKSSKYAFEMHFDYEAYVIGIGHFEYVSMYPFTVNRNNYHIERFDYYQPMLQDIGDQPVYLTELNGAVLSEEGVPLGNHPNFGYQLQDAEYKFAVPTVHGGFINNLPSWVFIDFYTQYFNNITPEFLRLYPFYLDDFFTSLTGMSAESYFHFMNLIYVNCQMRRKMQFQPGILQQ